MIKNLLNADEDPPEGTKVITEETVILPAGENPPPPAEAVSAASKAAAEDAPPSADAAEIVEDESLFRAVANGEQEPLDEAALEAELADLGIDLYAPVETGGEEMRPPARPATIPVPPVSENLDIAGAQSPSKSTHAAQSIFENRYDPASAEETVRQSGLAYSAAIVLVGAVVLMMIFGWLADLLFGTSPWGVVGGIVLGGAIGFVQFFRITSGIFKK